MPHKENPALSLHWTNAKQIFQTSLHVLSSLFSMGQHEEKKIFKLKALFFTSLLVASILTDVSSRKLFEMHTRSPTSDSSFLCSWRKMP